MTQTRVINLASRPQKGQPATLDNFELATVELPGLEEGEVLLKNLYMTIDPAHRSMMEVRKGFYVDPYYIGQPLYGLAIGQVVKSRLEGTEKGALIVHYDGWKEHSILDGSGLFMTVDPEQGPIPAFLYAMGLIGFSAHVGIHEIAKVKTGEVVFVSAAAGGVGTIACQLAKLAGARVIGSCGSDDKVDYLLNEIGIDAAFNFHKVDSIEAAVREHAPDGIDVYFENVGGAHADAAIQLLKEFGRFAICGQISDYYDEETSTGPKHFTLVQLKRLTIQGYLVFDHMDKYPGFQKKMGQWIAEGKIRYREMIREGLECAPQALIDMFAGKNIGKMMIHLGDPELSIGPPQM